MNGKSKSSFILGMIYRCVSKNKHLLYSTNILLELVQVQLVFADQL